MCKWDMEYKLREGEDCSTNLSRGGRKCKGRGIKYSG